MDNTAAVSPWIARHAGLLPAGGRVLDLACGRGRHTRFLLQRGHPVTAIDVDTTGVADLRGEPGAEIRQLDLEVAEWPLEGETFSGIVVTNYLHRPHLDKLINNLKPDGVLLYATFAAGHEVFGRPRNPDFLLRAGELAQVFGRALTVVAVSEETVPPPRAAVRQRICVVGHAHPAAVQPLALN